MARRILILIGIFYFLALFEISFLIHFKILNKVPSLILILILLLNSLENPNRDSGLFVAFFGGLFWDIFSTRPIGFHILILITLAIFIKLFLKKYVRFQIFKRAQK